MFSSNFFANIFSLNFFANIFSVFIACLIKWSPLPNFILTLVGISPIDINQYILGAIVGLTVRLIIKEIMLDIMNKLFYKKKNNFYVF